MHQERVRSRSKFHQLLQSDGEEVQQLVGDSGRGEEGLSRQGEELMQRQGGVRTHTEFRELLLQFRMLAAFMEEGKMKLRG